MTTDPAGTPRQQLAAELKRLRERAGLTQREIAAYATDKGDQSRVSRLERGRPNIEPRREEIELWAIACTASLTETNHLLDLLADVLDTTTVWHNAAPGSFIQVQQAIARRERAAGKIRTLQVGAIFGLAQTRAYARALLGLLGVDDLDRAVDARMARQAILLDEGTRLDITLTEHAIRYQPATSEVQAAQLRHLLKIAGYANLTLRVLPTVTSPPVPPYENSFTLYEDRDGGELPMVETELADHGATTTTKTWAVESYRARLAWLHTAALAGDEAAEFIAGVAGGLRPGPETSRGA